MSKTKKTKTDSHSYDVMYAAYLINEWTREMIVHHHIKHIKVTKDKTGMIVTLEALSSEEFPEFDKHD